MPAPVSGKLVVDDLVIDFAGRRLLRGGVVQPLEPKAFAVLALLAGSPGQVFTRDEILDAVWSHRHVTPGVLNRIVTLVRQALGEGAQSARLLQTLHGVGYRFDLPPDAGNVAPDPDPTPARPATRAGPEAGAAAIAAAAPAPARTRQRWLAVGGLVLAVAVAVATAAWDRLRPTLAAPDPAPPLHAHAAAGAVVPAAPAYTLVVLPLEPIGDGESSQDIARGLADELIGSLARIRGLRVIARESTRLAVAHSTDAAALVQSLGITHVLEGTLQQAGQTLRIRLRLVQAGSGAVVWVQTFDRDAAEVFSLQREIAQAVATALSLTMGLPEGPSARGGDADYLRRYLAAEALFGQRSISGQVAERAESAFRALLRERPDDARARAGLVRALELRAYRRQHLTRELREQALQEAAIVHQLDPDHPGPYLIRGAAACRSNEWQRCFELLGRAYELDPSGSGWAPDSSLAQALMQAGYLERGETILRQALAADPFSPGIAFALARALDTQGRHDEALAHFNDDDPFHIYGRWFNAVWRGDLALASSIAEHGLDGQRDLEGAYWLLQPSYVAVTRALADPERWPEAMAQIERWEQSAGTWNFLRILAPEAQQHAADAINHLSQARQRGQSSWHLLLWSRPLAWLRRDPAFQDYLRDSGLLDYWRAHGFPSQCRPAGEGAHCG